MHHHTTLSESSPLLHRPTQNTLTKLQKRPSFLVSTTSQKQHQLRNTLHSLSLPASTLPLVQDIGINMAQGGVDTAVASPYEEALDALSSLITERSRADKSNSGDRFDLLFDYLKILDLDEAISRMKVIHVAGTKGKGSTCTFSESILRHCGFRTGLFTSPHLIDVRERFRLNGMDITEEFFLANFWWCYHRLKENSSDNIPMPPLFRFLTLLAFKIFAEEQVDVVILEVGLGGKLDATNVVQSPIVCGISSLGYDHTEILGDTLGEIAGEKAGIFKSGVPAFTVPQPEEAMRVLEERAIQLRAELKVIPPLDSSLLNGLNLGLEGEHQYQNAALAVALCSTWLRRTGQVGVSYLGSNEPLPEEFIKGLTKAKLQGRAQVVPDYNIKNPENLVFYLDGAHTPESMDVCARWFSSAVREENKEHSKKLQDDFRSSNHVVHEDNDKKSERISEKILLFNCMSVRDPQLLLTPLVKTCASHGIYFQRALFVPNISVYNKVISHTLPLNDSQQQVDLSWQFTIQKVWENLVLGEKGETVKNSEALYKEANDDSENNVTNCENSAVFPSLPSAIKWLRNTVEKNNSVHFQVLVTGSLHLVGDVLRLVKK